MNLHFYNNLHRRLEVFSPTDPANVTVYLCGPTVYNYVHIGNARGPVVFDVLIKLLRRRYPNLELTIVADNDAKPDRTDNPGVAAATEAARDNDARLALSDFAGDANDTFAKLQLQMMGAFAEFERNIIRRRQAEGIVKAKALGKFKGGTKRIDRDRVNQLREDGLSTYKIAKAMGISCMSVHRILNHEL